MASLSDDALRAALAKAASVVGSIPRGEFVRRLRALADKADDASVDDTGPASNMMQSVYDHWVAATGRDAKRCRFTASRKAKVRARLREGYTLEDITAAIDHVAASEFHQGGNDEGRRYDDIELICRNGAKLEQFRDMDAPAKPISGKLPPQRKDLGW